MTSVMTRATLTPVWPLCPFLNLSQLLVLLPGAFFRIGSGFSAQVELFFPPFRNSHHCLMQLMCPHLDHQHLAIIVLMWPTQKHCFGNKVLCKLIENKIAYNQHTQRECGQSSVKPAKVPKVWKHQRDRPTSLLLKGICIVLSDL